MPVERRADRTALADLGEDRLGHPVVDDLAVDPDARLREPEREGSPCLRRELRSDANSCSDDGERAAAGDRYDRRLDPDKRPAGGERLRRLHLSLADERILNLLQSRGSVHREEILTLSAQSSHALRP